MLLPPLLQYKPYTALHSILQAPQKSKGKEEMVKNEGVSKLISPSTRQFIQGEASPSADKTIQNERQSIQLNTAFHPHILSRNNAIVTNCGLLYA